MRKYNGSNFRFGNNSFLLIIEFFGMNENESEIGPTGSKS